MSRSTFHSDLKFLLDENVKRRLEHFLTSKRFNVFRAPKGISNGELAVLSKSEERILVTNDSDFANPELYSKESLFSVIWLRIPQDKPSALLKSFSILLKDKSKPEDFEGHLVVLEEKGFEVFSLGSETLTK